ncbi:DUF1593 domain-containing protein [Algoriphagus sp. H41]|uniref:DUF1593 domain-containing protein n=1 Tax=Algoriphagus oliviformis TaxID=2811231 RepID=A0ABS3C2G0_9BACT|nr:nucleoside hydrolase-like domain-containing protein [Algoriphagus oliviformis]MBN7810791.1 DUF1593 domain-containing protein [Algoriphagus oliviformis]
MKWIRIIGLGIMGIVAVGTLLSCEGSEIETSKPRVLVSSDIGGTDPDDFQSMIHLLMYADQVELEGLISSPFGEGSKKDILDIIGLYEQDYPQLLAHAPQLPSPNSLRAITKQGEKEAAPFKGYASATEGSEWIIQCAKKKSDQPLWVLVWGGIEDVAQALHDAPEIKEKIRVYWIGGPNKKWSINAYSYLAAEHPDLWMIEANATYRGWFMDAESTAEWKGDTYYERYISGRGAMGKDFVNYYEGNIKMGDTPSLAYLLDGNPDDPTGESWGGSFGKIDRSARRVFEGGSTVEDTVSTYATLEWHFSGPVLDIPLDSAVFRIEIQKQVWPGYYLGDGRYGVKYSPKQAETGSYVTSSSIPELDGLRGGYTSVNPWPGRPSPLDFLLGPNWYSDRPDSALFIENQQGAKTISKHREAFLSDWAARWKWLE